MRFLLSAHSFATTTTSNGSESDDVQFEIIQLVVLIHLLEKAFQGSSPSLLRSPPSACFRVQSIKL